MLIERLTFQANYGRGDELVDLFREWRDVMMPRLNADFPTRIYTDRTGKMFTVTIDVDFPDLEAFAAYGAREEAMYGDPAFADWFGRMTPLVATGERQLLNLVT